MLFINAYRDSTIYYKWSTTHSKLSVNGEKCEQCECVYQRATNWTCPLWYWISISFRSWFEGQQPQHMDRAPDIGICADVDIYFLRFCECHTRSKTTNVRLGNHKHDTVDMFCNSCLAKLMTKCNYQTHLQLSTRAKKLHRTFLYICTSQYSSSELASHHVDCFLLFIPFSKKFEEKKWTTHSTFYKGQSDFPLGVSLKFYPNLTCIVPFLSLTFFWNDSLSVYSQQE